jgi:hypothetical protein
MKTGNRRPKLHKPTKGQKSYLKQGLKALKKLMRGATGGTKKDQNWFTPKAVRAQYLFSLRGSHTPHQGGAEQARRVRQMANNTHGYPTHADTRQTYNMPRKPVYFEYHTAQETLS